MQNMCTIKYDVVIPVGMKDLSFVQRVVVYIRKFFNDAGYVYLISNKKNIRRLKKISSENVFVIDEDSLYSGLTFNNIRDLLVPRKEDASVGWYFQQFLKIAFGLSNYAKDYYLTWDADTIPLTSIPFFEDNHPLFTAKTEYNPNYFRTIEKLFGINKNVNYSFVAEHMIFSSKIVKEMVCDINKSKSEGNNWYEKIINSGDFSSALPIFSEFETYGTYVINKYPELYKTRYLNTFRRGGLIRGRLISDKLLGKISFDVDTISFEITDMPVFPYNLYNYYQMLMIIIRNVKQYSIKLIIEKTILRLKGEKSNSEIIKVMNRNK